MANIYDTHLECVTNCELLKLTDPKKIINKTASEFRFSIADELVFETRWATMHDDILSLSEKFPKEVFLARYYFVDAIEAHQGLCVRYEDGKDEFIGYEPCYTWIIYDHLIKELGEDTFHRLWRRIRKYIFRLDQTKKSLLDEELHCDILEHHFDECVTSYVTIHAEYENFKLSVDKTRKSELTFHGYRRNSEFEDWREILIESSNGNINDHTFLCEEDIE